MREESDGVVQHGPKEEGEDGGADAEVRAREGCCEGDESLARPGPQAHDAARRSGRAREVRRGDMREELRDSLNRWRSDLSHHSCSSRSISCVRMRSCACLEGDPRVAVVSGLGSTSERFRTPAIAAETKVMPRPTMERPMSADARHTRWGK